MAQFTYPLSSAGVVGHETGYYPNSLTTTVSSFEDGDIAEYAGDTSLFSTTTSPVYEGSYALANTSGNAGAITDTNDLPAPAQGDTFSAWLRFDGSTEYSEFAWAVQSETGISNLSGYTVKYEGTAGLTIKRYDTGSQTDLATDSSYDPPTGNWYRGKVTWGTDGSIAVDVYDSGGTLRSSASATDTTYTSGGVGWRSYDAGSGAYGDYYRIL